MNNFSKTSLLISLALLTAPNVYADNIEMNTANIQAMDKITGRVSELNIPVNGLANFGTFSILVRKCVTKSPEETPENTAFIDVVDNYKSQNPVNIFKGWMFSSTPGINGVEHPIYDIWLLKCYNSDRTKHQVLSEEQLKFRDELPMVRQEKPKQNIRLSALDNNIPQTESADITPQTSENIKENNLVEQKEEIKEESIIKIDINDETNNNETTIESVVEDDFIAEGEEILSKAIVIDNEIIAQDEQNQKAIEGQNIKTEDAVINEIQE